ncbi:N-6 DNA methylase [uncultured Tateyamaria sp.]|uniref:N-6 DNA methylase n=1 Tax=uncultured Tateyamaria sp. TaxID=455651 RepID=UPI002615A79C|nr:N-6 DNA methylase [uncultured Tateyamaria sp.]
MAFADPREAREVFLRSFKQIAPGRHRYEVWRDFVCMAACSLHNGIQKDQRREHEYLEIIGRYQPQEQLVFPELMACLVTMLDDDPRDVLGSIYMELETANKDIGQFFTPPELSEVMARLTFGEHLDALKARRFITVQEPACGAGGMVLALVKVLIDAGHNPAEKLWVQCIDVDRLAALMCYVQLALWNVPAEVIVGNTLTLEMREVWHTPAHLLGGWSSKLRQRVDAQIKLAEPPTNESADFSEHIIDWHGQNLTIRFCPAWLGEETAHLEILTEDRTPHPISDTGYKSHFVQLQQVEEAGGPVAYVLAWLRVADDGKPRQLSLF